MSKTQHLFDIEFATLQLGGNVELLHKMLRKFCDEFEATPQIIATAIDQNNNDEAKLKVHTTKGLSGNLGLTALFECAKVLDQQIRKDAVKQTQLQAFTAVMRDTIAHIRSLDLSIETSKRFSADAKGNSLVEKKRLVERLTRNEFIDDNTLFTHINALSLTQPEKEILKTLIEELQYDKAIEMINQAG